jgi:hypothetical protein
MFPALSYPNEPTAANRIDVALLLLTIGLLRLWGLEFRPASPAEALPADGQLLLERPLPAFWQDGKTSYQAGNKEAEMILPRAQHELRELLASQKLVNRF